MLIDCGCDKRRDIMFTEGRGHIPLALLVALAGIVGYIAV